MRRGTRLGKNPESHRGSQRKDISPLTQGLNYRSACDVKLIKMSNRLLIIENYDFRNRRNIQKLDELEIRTMERSICPIDPLQRYRNLNFSK